MADGVHRLAGRLTCVMPVSERRNLASPAGADVHARALLLAGHPATGGRPRGLPSEREFIGSRERAERKPGEDWRPHGFARRR